MKWVFGVSNSSIARVFANNLPSRWSGLLGKGWSNLRKLVQTLLVAELKLKGEQEMSSRRDALPLPSVVKSIDTRRWASD